MLAEIKRKVQDEENYTCVRISSQGMDECDMKAGDGAMPAMCAESRAMRVKRPDHSSRRRRRSERDREVATVDGPKRLHHERGIS